MIRYATIGTNFIVDWFLHAAQNIPELYYQAVYSRSKDTAAAFAEKHHAETISVSLEELAAADNIDAVYIASPNCLHYEQAALFLSHGKHVLCEKTIVSNCRELESLTRLARDHHVVLMEAVRTMYTEGFRCLEESLPRIGPIRHASFRFCQYSSRYDKYKSGIVENAFNPAFSNGALMDLGVYCVHPLVRLFGMPDRIHADSVLLGNGVDGAGCILAHYPQMQAELVYSKISSGRIPSEIQGENGTLVIDTIGNPNDITYYDKKGTEASLYHAAPTPIPDMASEILHWIEQIRLCEEDPQQNNELRYSHMALQIMDEARKQSGIVFPADRMTPHFYNTEETV
jgi:predicted dehydrogenase